MNVFLSKSIDKYFGGLIVLLFGFFFRKCSYSKKPRKILLVRLWALGDSVITLVLIEALKQTLPNAKIYVVARSRNKVIYEHNKNIEQILSVWEMLKFKDSFDLVFDTEPYLNISALLARIKGKIVVGFNHGVRAKLYDYTILFNKKQHMVQNYLDMIRVLGFAYNTKNLERVETKKSDKEVVKRFLKKKKIKNVAGLTVGAAETARAQRMWPLERFAAIGDYLSEKGFCVFFIGSKNELDIIEKARSMMNHQAYVSYEHFTLSQTISLIEYCSLFIANDTGPMHIAAAQGVKTIGIFGANTPVLWGPYGKGNISLYKEHKDGPCIDNTKGTIRKCDGCINSLRKIRVKDVKNAIEKLLK